jgi:hypothetical protein
MGSADLVELLLANKADVDIKDKVGRTPIHYARSTDVADLLLRRSVGGISAILSSITDPNTDIGSRIVAIQTLGQGLFAKTEVQSALLAVIQQSSEFSDLWLCATESLLSVGASVDRPSRIVVRALEEFDRSPKSGARGGCNDVVLYQWGSISKTVRIANFINAVVTHCSPNIETDILIKISSIPDTNVTVFNYSHTDDSGDAKGSTQDDVLSFSAARRAANSELAHRGHGGTPKP